MLYTSYYGNVKRLPKDKYIVVAISGGKPDGFNGPHFKKLAPSYENFKDYKEGKQSFDKFAERYKSETLSGLRVPTIVQEIYDMVGVNDPNVHIVLTCYEKDSSQCHRSLVSKWLTDGGILTRELILD